MNRVNNVISINTTLDEKFYQYWFKFLRPFHNLTNKEIEVISMFLKHRFILSKAINDDNLLEKVILNEDFKRQVREECGISTAHFQVIMSSLKKKGIIQKDRINPKFIPKLRGDDSNFQLLLLFSFK